MNFGFKCDHKSLKPINAKSALNHFLNHLIQDELYQHENQEHVGMLERLLFIYNFDFILKYVSASVINKIIWVSL